MSFVALGHLSTLVLDSPPIVLQSPALQYTWLGPVVGAAVGAVAGLAGSILAAIITLKTNARMRLEQHDTVKREALSELLALTYQLGTGDIDGKINAQLSRLKLLVRPKSQSSMDLLSHLDNLYASPSISEWRKRFVSLSLEELH
jgi:hypothetical protein